MPIPYDVEVGRADDRVVVTRHTVSLVHVDFVQTHFASYFGWIDLGFQALMKANGWSYSRYRREGSALPLVHVECDYWIPLALDTEFELHSYVSETGRTSAAVTHQFVVGSGAVGGATTGTSVVATALARHVHVVLGDGAPVTAPLPEWVLAARR